MKLQSMNCPNCNGQLKKEGEGLICSSCGSAFAIDYDASDVAYQALQKQDEIFKKTKGFRIAIAVIALLVMAVMIFVFVKFIGSFHEKSSEMKNRNRNAIVTEIPQNEISKETILSDSEFLKSAEETAVSLLKSEHKEVDYYDFMWEKNLMTPPKASLDKDPELIGTYLLQNAFSSDYVMVFKLEFAFEYESEKNIRTMYDCVILSNLSVSDDGKIESNYQVRTERHTGADLSFMAYDDKDRLYNEVVLGKPGYEVTQLT